MYTIALLLMTAASILWMHMMTTKTCKVRKSNKIIFEGLFILLTAMAVFRYGQGQDYFGYQLSYDHEVGAGYSLADIFSRGDPGFRVTMHYAKLLGVSFEMFASFVGLLTMLLFYVFLKKQCKSSVFAFLFFYCVVWIIYVIGALRQGLAMGVWLCFAYEEIEKRNG